MKELNSETEEVGEASSYHLMEKTLTKTALQTPASLENQNSYCAKNPDGEVSQEVDPTGDEQQNNASLDTKANPINEVGEPKADCGSNDSLQEKEALHSLHKTKSPNSLSISESRAEAYATTMLKAEAVTKTVTGAITQGDCNFQSVKSTPNAMKKAQMEEPASPSQTGSVKDNEPETKLGRPVSNASSTSSSVPSNANSNHNSVPLDHSSSVPSGLPRVIHAEISNRSVAPQVPPTSSTPISNIPKSKTLRRGKWTMEEESYVARVIQDFNSGFLNAPAGTTLRSYLSEKLQCDPMRITKKFTGDACIGKRVFHPAVRSAGNATAIDKAQTELDALERRWRRRLEMQQRESAKKAAASAAAVNSSPQNSRVHLVQGVPVAILGAPGMHPVGHQIQQTVVTQAASWLDRANAILKGSKAEGGATAPRIPPPRNDIDAVANNDIETQMNEVRRLIYEGPLIQQTAAGLPHLLSYDGQENGTSRNQSLPLEPADKRQRRTSVSGAEDAEALVGFLRSVRASAASGQSS